MKEVQVILLNYNYTYLFPKLATNNLFNHVCFITSLYYLILRITVGVLFLLMVDANESDVTLLKNLKLELLRSN